MNWMIDICNNHILLNSFVAWAAAQLIKTIIYAVMNRTLDIRRLLGAGGMPSSHTATVVAMAVTAGLEYGLDSAIFAVTAVLVLVVTHDAMNVRMEAGKHAMLLNQLMETIQGLDFTEERLKELLGHTPLQVFFGAVLGAVIAFAMHG